MKNKVIAEGKILQNFLLHEMDYYVPSQGTEDESSLNHDYVGDVDSSFEEYPIDDNLETGTDFGYSVDDVMDDDLDMYGDDDLNYDDELDGDDSFLMDMENDPDFMDDQEEEFYDNELGGEVPVEDYFESKKKARK